jgi:hypothetical protein
MCCRTSAVLFSGYGRQPITGLGSEIDSRGVCSPLISCTVASGWIALKKSKLRHILQCTVHTGIVGSSSDKIAAGHEEEEG